MQVRGSLKNAGLKPQTYRTGLRASLAGAVLGAAVGKPCSHPRIRTYSNNYSTMSDKQVARICLVGPRFVQECRAKAAPTGRGGYASVAWGFSPGSRLLTSGFCIPVPAPLNKTLSLAGDFWQTVRL